MAQLFPPGINVVSRVVIIGTIFSLVGLAGLGYLFVNSPYLTEVGIAQAQPVPFSHRQHVGELGLDCRYCHASVTRSDFAGMPATETCMGCHRDVAPEAPTLELVRASDQNNQPLEWIRVHDLPDFVYFNHGIHVNKGIGCETCHGRVDQMPVVGKVQTLYMAWCLACHRQPERFVRPHNEVFTLGWEPPSDQATLGPQLVTEYGIKVTQLTDCSICHR
jgi:hypothetical protein